MRWVLFVAVLATPSLAWGSSGAPVLSASEISGAPGTAVQVRGSGFAAAGTVTLGIEGRTIAVTRAGNSGGFSVAVRIPAGLAGGDELLVASDREGTEAHVPFIVLGRLRGRVADIAIASRALSGETPMRSTTTWARDGTGNVSLRLSYRDTSTRTSARSVTAPPRGILGVSAGGYGAALAGLHHLATFSVVESWSG